MATLTTKRHNQSPTAPSASKLRRIDALWRASNYLSFGQIYLLDNPRLRKPLVREHVKPRLFGHWGATPGLNFLYTSLTTPDDLFDCEKAPTDAASSYRVQPRSLALLVEQEIQ